MNVADQLYTLIPGGYKGKKKILEHYQTVPDIMKEMIKYFQKYKYDYDYISPEFYSGNFEHDLNGLWNFCKHNLQYKAEVEESQQLQSPSAILYLKKVDCKCLALFCAGVCDSWSRLGLYNLSTLNFIFASYDSNDTPGHVFVECNGFWVDPVLNYFDERKIPTFEVQKNLVMLYGISGIKRKIGDDDDQINDTPPDTGSGTDDNGNPLPSNEDSENPDGSIDYTDGSTLSADGVWTDGDGKIIGEGISSINPDGSIDYIDGATLSADGTMVDQNGNSMGEGIDSWDPTTGLLDYAGGCTLDTINNILYKPDGTPVYNVVDFDPITGNADFTDGSTLDGNGTLYDPNGNVVATDVTGFDPVKGVVTYDGGNTETLAQINAPGTNANGAPTKPGNSSSGGAPSASAPAAPSIPKATGTPGTAPNKPTTPIKATTKVSSLSKLLSGNLPLIIIGVIVVGIIFWPKKK